MSTQQYYEFSKTQLYKGVHLITTKVLCSKDKLHIFSLTYDLPPKLASKESLGSLVYISFIPPTKLDSKLTAFTEILIDHAREWGYNQVIVAHLYSYRTSVNKQISFIPSSWKSEQIRNRIILEKLVLNPLHKVIFIWGNVKAQMEQAVWIKAMMEHHKVKAYVYGITSQGQPVSPGYWVYQKNKPTLELKVYE